jgi:hypothetical protein
MLLQDFSFTYDHRIMRTRLPVRSALFKHNTGGLVVKWVTISESLLLYVFDIFGGHGRSSLVSSHLFVFLFVSIQIDKNKASNVHLIPFHLTPLRHPSDSY